MTQLLFRFIKIVHELFIIVYVIKMSFLANLHVRKFRNFRLLNQHVDIRYELTVS